MSGVDQVFTALADPNRRDILDRVSRGPMTASQLAEPLAISVTGVLKHLRALEDAQLVTTRKIGRARWCELSPDGLDPAASWISSRRRLWDQRLNRFQARLSRQSDTDA